MGEPALGIVPSTRTIQDRLDSWKEIAAYLNRDVTTVQRWEKREGMPVHRHLHDKAGSVYAFRTELAAWMRGRNLRATPESGNGEAASVPPAPSTASGRSGSRPRWRSLLPLAIVAVLVAGAALWMRKTERFWRNPVADAKFQTVADFDGLEQSAAVSRDGHLIALLSDWDGPTDVWVTQAGSGEFHNLTHGQFSGLVNPSIRNLGFSPDGSLVTFWVRKPSSSGGDNIGVWAAPILGGEPRVYLDGVAEFDWTRDGSRLAYHTSGPGDPLFVSDGGVKPDSRPIFSAPSGLHSHFPLWSPNMDSLYFVEGELPDKLDIWRIHSTGGAPERITSRNARVSYPVLLDRRTLLYLATDPDGSGPWLYGMDVDRRVPHRLSGGLDRYTSLASSADGRRLVVTRATPHETLWSMRLSEVSESASDPVRIPSTTGAGSSPRLGPNYLLYVSVAGAGESVWRFANAAGVELWRGGEGTRVFGGPAISPDGQSIAFFVRLNGKSLLYVMRADGTNARVLGEALDLQGAPAWSPDSQSIIAAAKDSGMPHLFRIPLNGGSPAPFVNEYSLDPAWSPDGGLVAYSGPDIGTTFSVKAVMPDGTPYRLPALTLTRGARHLTFLPDKRSLVFLRGDIQHKDLWVMDLATGAERRLTHLPPDFNVRDFDVSHDGREVVFERTQERSDLILLDLQRP